MQSLPRNRIRYEPKSEDKKLQFEPPKKQQSIDAKPQKKVHDLSRTGIEYPIMPKEDMFIANSPEFEPLTEKPCSYEQMNQYVRLDTERANILANGGSTGPIVYEARAFTSPYYTPKDPLLDEGQQMELVPHVPFEDPEGKVKTITGPSYQFETGSRQARINRYY